MADISRPRDTTVKRLFARSINRCAFPDCSNPVIDAQTGTVIAEICHIHAQKSNGPRYEVTMSSEQVHAFENLVLMCPHHHKVIDTAANIPPYTADFLRQIKQGHEHAADAIGLSAPQLSDEQARTLIDQSVTYEENATHLDFRQAVFRVGGEGGFLGGGGGNGGVLTIIGSHRLPAEAIVDANGQDAVAPGGGGGGGGTVQFVGRALESDERTSGFSVSSFFAVNAFSFDGLLNVLGGVWVFFKAPQPPARTSIHLVLVIELGGIAPDALIRLAIDAKSPSGQIAALEICDVAGLPISDLTPRCTVIRRLDFEIDALGIWEFRASSGDIVLATHRIEYRAV